MIALVLAVLLAIGLCFYVFRATSDKKSRIFGVCIALAATIAFGLYIYGIVGLSIESAIVSMFGKAGIHI